MMCGRASLRAVLLASENRAAPGGAAEIALAHDFYEDQRLGLGEGLELEIHAAINLIAQMPRAWEAWPGLEDVRLFPLDTFPFLLPYFAGDERLALLALAHEKRRPGYWAGRLTDV